MNSYVHFLSSKMSNQDIIFHFVQVIKKSRDIRSNFEIVGCSHILDFLILVIRVNLSGEFTCNRKEDNIW